ncbi:MAG: serine/threonine protein kinase [Gammaproteobacteria bacterium]|nr:serine/threonine protein kinase [Gammaproteobacteria bacterium]
MDPVFERRALDAFEQALEWSPGERARRLKEALGSEPALHAAVLELFAADAAGTGSLPTEVPEPVAVAALPPPSRVGVYRVGELLGEGGMGAVYRGERDDGLFTHAVAVKLIRPSLLSAQVHARFATERQILASLRHPNIAQLFDAGIDGEGRPWLTMELLEGQPIDAWVAARRPGERRLIGLLRQVCAAVQHAHQNLVVHADIKPSNIVVSADGHVKLLDFGIAQLIAPDGEAEVPDAAAPRPLTRAYASPEQRAGQVPKPAADVYAIGVLMHQLFAGELPRESTETVVMPVRDLRGAELPGQLPGDLGYIIAKAMHPDPAARYATVSEIVTDLNRYLDHEPVSARRADFWYTGRCFVRRHRWRLGSKVEYPPYLPPHAFRGKTSGGVWFPQFQSRGISGVK